MSLFHLPVGQQSQRETLGTKFEKDWPVRKHLAVGENIIINEPLVDSRKIIFLPLHIKLGLMKHFVKALDTDGYCFKYLCESFPALSFEKIQAGVFDCPQIRQLMKDNAFLNSMNKTERQAWLSFVSVVENFLGNTKTDDYRNIVETMLENYHKLSYNMSIKEQAECFHQDIKVMEERYQKRWDILMMADIAGVFNENALEKPIPEDRSNESLVQSKVTQNITFSPKFFKLNNNLLFKS